MWCFDDVVHAPLQLVQSRLALAETVGKLGVDYACDPVDNENFSTRELPGSFQHGNRLVYPGNSMQQRDRGRMLSSQQADRAQVERPLDVRQPRPEFLQSRREKLCAIELHVRIDILPHEQE